MCYVIINSIISIFIFNFLIFIHFRNQKTLKPSLAQKLKFIFKFSTITGQMNVPRWTHLGRKEWRKDGKTFIRCYAIALKFWDEFNANFVLLYFSTCRSIKMWHLYLKKMEKNNKAVQWSSLIFSKTFSIPRSILSCHSKEIVHLLL